MACRPRRSPSPLRTTRSARDRACPRRGSRGTPWVVADSEMTHGCPYCGGHDVRIEGTRRGRRIATCRPCAQRFEVSDPVAATVRDQRRVPGLEITESSDKSSGPKLTLRWRWRFGGLKTTIVPLVIVLAVASLPFALRMHSGFFVVLGSFYLVCACAMARSLSILVRNETLLVVDGQILTVRDTVLGRPAISIDVSNATRVWVAELNALFAQRFIVVLGREGVPDVVVLRGVPLAPAKRVAEALNAAILTPVVADEHATSA
jgi:hypothetical protein